jgi:hypothetical protein
VIELTDKKYVHLNQVPELVRLYAEIDCDLNDYLLEKRTM